MRLAAAFLSVGFTLQIGCVHNGRQAPSDVQRDEARLVEEFWPNGMLRLRKWGVARSGPGTPGPVNHGSYRRWYDNSQKEYEVAFVMGKKEGIATTWHKNGCKWREEHYANGKRHGVSTSWDENGRKRQEEQHFEGKPHGTWTIWDEHGRIKWQQSFVHGKPASRS